MNKGEQRRDRSPVPQPLQPNPPTEPPQPTPLQAPSVRVDARAPTLGLVEYGLIALQSMLWGSTFFFIAIARFEIPPLTLTAARLVPATLLLGCVVLAMGLRLPATWPEWRRMLLFSTLNNVLPFVLIILAQREVTGGIAAIFMATTPLCGLLLAPWLIAEERFTWRRLVGILIGIAGVAVITGASGAAGSWRAQGMLLMAALCYSLANIYARKFFAGYHPFAVASAQTIGSLAVAVVGAVALLVEQPWLTPLPSSAAFFSVLVMGIAGSGLAPLCHFTVLRRGGPVNAMLASIVVPITPIVLGVAFLGEHIGARELLGGAIIALALIIIDGRAFAPIIRRLRKPGSGS